MSPLMESAVAAFGQSLGIAELRPDDNDVVSLAFEQRGNLCLEGSDDALLIYLIQTLPGYETNRYRRALALCHYRQGHPFAVQAGLRGDEALVFLVRLPEADCTPPNLERAVEYLTELQRRAAEGG